MRCFIAIDLSPELRHKIASVQERLPKNGLKLVEPENLHFTLRFLGEISEEQAKQVGEVLRTMEYPKFDVELDKIGGFPSLKKARIIWLGIRREQDVNNLVNMIEDKLTNIGIPRDDKMTFSESHLYCQGSKKYYTFLNNDKKFNAHLTIARAKQPVNIDSLKDISENSHMNQIVNSFSLKQSTLTPKGPIYKELVRILLT